jgi:hypothetical protein
MPKNLPSILTRLGIPPEKWLTMSQHFGEHFTGLVGDAENVQNNIEHFDNGKPRQRILDACEKQGCLPVFICGLIKKNNQKTHNMLLTAGFLTPTRQKTAFYGHKT